jgi:hypothetical protein
MTLTVDAATLAKGWLAVAAASSGDKERPQLSHTIFVEQYPAGLRLSATDSYVLLTTWIPDIQHELDPEPSIDEIPYATAVAQDTYGRAAGLLAHLLRLARADEEAKKLDLDVQVSLNVPWQPDGTAGADLQLDGFAALAVTIEHPGTERVQLTVYEGPWPNYRAMLLGFKLQRPMRLAISQRVAAEMARAAKVFGPDTVIFQRFGGEDKAVSVVFGEEPTVTGLVMPCKWDFDSNRPWGELNPDDVVAGAEMLLDDGDGS